MATQSGIPVLRMHLFAVLTVLFFGLPVFAQNSGSQLRYKLHTGDHLVYREVFEREGKSSGQSFRTRSVFLNHLVVLDEASETVLAGIQRNRQSAELLEYREHGKDRLAQEMPNFAARMAKRPAHFSDANVFSASGEPQMPVTTVREANSKLLYAIGEVAALPSGTAQVGTEMRGPLGLTMRLVRFEPSGDESCAVFQDAGTRPGLHLSFSFCPQSGTLAKLEFSGEYHEFGDSIVREHVTLDLTEARHNETPSSWLSEPEVQRGALSAYLIASAASPDQGSLEKLLRTGTPEVQALALAVYYQNRLSPPQDLLAQLSNSKDVEVQRIASRFGAKVREEPSSPCALPAQHYQHQKPGTTLRSMTAPAFEGAPYMMHVPIDYRGDEPFPVLIYLSGGSGQAFDAALSAEEVLGHSGYLAVYPHASGAMWWEPKPTAMVHELLLEILRTYNVDTNRVYLAGFSNGATGALYYGTLWPERFAAIGLLMGAGVNSPIGEAVPLKNLSNVPLLLLHGDKDTIIPSSASVATYDELRTLHPRVAPELHILKGRGHEIALSSDDGYTMPFLERFRREPFPRSISMKITDLNFPRRYWVEVMEKGSGPAEVEGRILPGNTIELKTRNVRRLRLLLRTELFTATGPVHIRVNGSAQAAQQQKQSCDLLESSAKTFADAFLGYTDEIVVNITK